METPDTDYIRETTPSPSHPFARWGDGSRTRVATDGTHTARRVLRLAHMTDWHIQPERGAAEGVADCLRQVYELPEPPDLILNGGDAIMSAVSANLFRAVQQWETWEQVLADYTEIPMYHCLGNHDIWGWNRKKSGCTGEEPLYGKQMAMERLNLETTYYTFEQAGWHFIVLDSLFPGGQDGYIARLDDEQMEWLAADLAMVPPQTPILILSHIPLLAGGGLFFTGTLTEADPVEEWVIPTTWLHADARRINPLFNAHPNIRLCLSGHLHLLDRAEYNGITYCCSGAVAGRWWRGDYHQTPPGYALIDLFEDGNFTYEYHPTHWKIE